MTAFWLSLGIVFAAELGDKSQLMAMAFAARYRFWTVMAGITAATLLVHLLSVAIGGAVGLALPTKAVNILAGASFLAFGIWTLRGDSLGDADQARAERTGRSAFLAISVAFILAELGDKTMLATVTLATQHGWVGTWLGSTVGMVAADALAVALGAALSRTVPDRAIKVGAAVLFFIVGVLLLADGFRA